MGFLGDLANGIASGVVTGAKKMKELNEQTSIYEQRFSRDSDEKLQKRFQNGSMAEKNGSSKNSQAAQRRVDNII